MHLRSNLSKARGLGSAKEGAHHWWMQRVTAIALIPLVIWFVISVIKATSNHGVSGVIYLLSSPVNAIAMILFLGTSIYHGTLGIKVIIEDYVHCPCGSKFLDIATKFIAAISIVAVTLAISLAHITSYKSPGKYQSGFWHGKKGSCHKEIHGAADDSAATGIPSDAEMLETEEAPIIEIETPKE